ncbi:MAG: hypothetical protein IKE23_10455 [Exiguobacterium sp.]|nr:hypothetical protein [Exiguobacterium sp.]
MLNVTKTNDGVAVLGDGDGLVELLKKVFGDEEILDKILDEEDCEEDEDEFDDDDTEILDETVITESEHLVSVGYRNDSPVLSINYDTPDNEYFVPAALLLAAAQLWPEHEKIETELKQTLTELAEDTRNYAMEIDN